MEKKIAVPRIKKIKGFNLLSKNQIVHILQFVDLCGSLACLKLNKIFSTLVKGQAWFNSYLKITDEIKARGRKLSIAQYIKDEAKYIKKLIKKLRVSNANSLRIFSELILKDLIEKNTDKKTTPKLDLPLDKLKYTEIKKISQIPNPSLNSSRLAKIAIPLSSKYSSKTLPVDNTTYFNLNQLVLSNKNIGSAITYLSYALCSYPYLIKIDLSGNNINEKGMKLISRSFRHTQSLKILDFKNNLIGSNGCKAVFNGLLNSRCRVVTLDLSDNDIFSSGLKLFAYDYIRLTSSCTHLNLENNCLAPEGSEIIAKALAKNRSLKSLNISCNGITEKGAKYFVDAFKLNKTLEFFYTGSNYLQLQGAKHIAEIIATTETLKYISIDANEFNFAGCDVLANALVINHSITTLDINSNQIGDKGIKSLFDSIRIESFLTSIDLGENNITIVGLSKIVNVLRENKKISHINLERNKFGVDGGKLIADLLNHNKALENLNLSGCLIRGGIKFLSESLKNNNTLKIINLSDNEITSSLFESFSEALKINSGLKSIYFQMNYLDDNICDNLADALKFNKSATVMNFDKNKITAKGVKLLIDSIKLNKQLNHIEFGQGLEDEQTISMLIEALKYNKSINS